MVVAGKISSDCFMANLGPSRLEVRKSKLLKPGPMAMTCLPRNESPQPRIQEGSGVRREAPHVCDKLLSRRGTRRRTEKSAEEMASGTTTTPKGKGQERRKKEKSH